MADYQFTWYGEKLENDILNAMLTALGAAARDAEIAIRENTPVDTGFLRDSTFAFVDAGEGDAPILVFGQRADYALYVELGTRFMDGHYQVTQAVNEIMPTVPSRIAQALQDAGWGGGGSGSFSSTEGSPNPYTEGPLTGLLEDARAGT
ncbi:MAG TPA: HK97 gp10 family phage protein [Candidatus Limnocylindria bacterium]|nr:HK97 gp10 family phage protein [Candidatus Limnocylindria bacterium]